MNTIKMYRLLSDNYTVEMVQVKCTQNRNARSVVKPYPHEAQTFFHDRGWTRKKPNPLGTVKSNLSRSVRRAVLDGAGGRVV